MSALLTNGFVYLTLFALLGKIWCSYRLWQRWDKSTDTIICLAFLFVFYTKGILELHGYWLLAKSYDATVIMRIYYAVFTSGILIMPFLTRVIITRQINPLSLSALFSFITAIFIYTLSTDYIVTGVTPLKYSYTAVRGEYYSIFQVVSIMALVAALVVPIRLYKSSKVESEKIRAFNFIVGTAPYVIFVFSVIIAMAFKVKINIAGVSPLFMTLYIGFLAANIRKDSLYDVRWRIPGTTKYKQVRRITAIFRRMTLVQGEDCKDLTLQYRAELVDALTKALGSQKKAAEQLGISRATASRIMRDHNCN